MDADTIQRFSRQLVLKGWSMKAQQSLGACAVLLAVDSSDCPKNVSGVLAGAAFSLASAGIGTVLVSEAIDESVAAQIACFAPWLKLAVRSESTTPEAEAIICGAIWAEKHPEILSASPPRMRLRFDKSHLRQDRQIICAREQLPADNSLENWCNFAFSTAVTALLDEHIKQQNAPGITPAEKV